MQCLEKVVGHEHDDHRLFALVFAHMQLDGLGQLESLDFGEGAFNFGNGRSHGGLESGEILNFPSLYLLSLVESCLCHDIGYGNLSMIKLYRNIKYSLINILRGGGNGIAHY